ncbi:hypothetical protein ABE61_03140 [Lysinibacillus sphaericus]|nr:hypothetical protein [Lysinibacillus sphaericus]MBG9477622.1 hypothetical protein [Lysinibacillus sphaericus]MBG9594351.1 hypothetical protein [Lysinibacillus sphaericus]
MRNYTKKIRIACKLPFRLEPIPHIPESKKIFYFMQRQYNNLTKFNYAPFTRAAAKKLTRKNILNLNHSSFRRKLIDISALKKSVVYWSRQRIFDETSI